MRPIIYPYKLGSKSAKVLSSSLSDVRAKRVRPDGRYRTFRNHLIINWGSATIPTWWEGRPKGGILNTFRAVAASQNKLFTYQLLRDTECRIPEFTTDSLEACHWLIDGTITRSVLNGHAGIGIKVWEPAMRNQFLHANKVPLYVKYVKKSDEYRVHVFNGVVIDAQQKKGKEGVESNYQIRNYDNGWVFCREEVVLPDDVTKQALLAVDGLGLDFGAVDVGWNQHYQEATVYEVNTAPGLTGTTLDKYTNAIRRLL